MNQPTYDGRTAVDGEERRVFTPVDKATGRRLHFDMGDVTVLSGSLERQGRGIKARVEIDGVRYKVVGASCGIPHCMCDSFLVEEGKQ